MQLTAFRRSMRAAFAVAMLALCAGAVGSIRAEGVAASLSCEFEGGTSSSYSGGTFSSRSPLPLRFGIVGIDLEQQQARLETSTAGAASGTLRVIRALNANHFLEVVPEGFLNLTTVYDLDPAAGAYPAVHSRHLGVLGQPVFAQYTGFCRARATP
ncbi:MAG: hypothetical protein ACK4MF_06555 [Hyphomicrobiaceae bacterium]